MSPDDPNVLLLEAVAAHLGEELLPEVVFVGGAVAGLLITDPAAPAIRPTEDVDLLVEALTLADYHRVGERLTAQGFRNDRRSGAPICRWLIGDVVVDVMPPVDAFLGFTNRWYGLALETAVGYTLPSGRRIRTIAAPVFLATKLEAFAGRGNRDYLSSHDLGDFVSVIDGRENLLEEWQASDSKLRSYLRDRVSELLAIPAFIEALPGHLPGDAGSRQRLPDLEKKLRTLASFGQGT